MNLEAAQYQITVQFLLEKQKRSLVESDWHLDSPHQLQVLISHSSAYCAKMN